MLQARAQGKLPWFGDLPCTMIVLRLTDPVRNHYFYGTCDDGKRCILGGHLCMDMDTLQADSLPTRGKWQKNYPTLPLVTWCYSLAISFKELKGGDCNFETSGLKSHFKRGLDGSSTWCYTLDRLRLQKRNKYHDTYY